MTVEDLCRLLQTAPVFQRGALVHVRLSPGTAFQFHEAGKICSDLRRRNADAWEFVITASDITLELAARMVTPNAIFSALLSRRGRAGPRCRTRSPSYRSGFSSSSDRRVTT